MRAILTYHSIDDSGSPISVSRAAFRRQLEWLVAEQVRVVPLNELAFLSDGSRAVALTFDDGIANIATAAAPILEANGMTATVFVVTRRVGMDNQWTTASRHRVPRLPLLGWEELGQLSRRGWTIGSHSRHHHRLPDCSDQQLEEEVEGAADDIVAALGVRPGWFAYPYGELDARVSSRTATTYQGACTTELRPLREREILARLPRIDAWYLRSWARAGWGGPRFRAILSVRRFLRAARAVVSP
jgi:peptidoglycan/xylan/chitin deacetylase (PgdA/CDA1 family)